MHSPITRLTSSDCKVNFPNSATSAAFSLAGRFPCRIFSPTGGPTTATLWEDDPLTPGTIRAVNDSAGVAVTFTWTAAKWTVCTDDQIKALMGANNAKLVAGGAFDGNILIRTGT